VKHLPALKRIFPFDPDQNDGPLPTGATGYSRGAEQTASEE
jgi:hypothetical protein